MHQTVLGVFATHTAAAHARDQLVDKGFDASRISIKHAGPDEMRRAAGPGVGAREDEGVMASIAHFFSDLFGSGDAAYAGHYSEAVRRGHVVLSVEADNSQLDTAQDVLSAAGAVDIDERISSWRGQGWDGFDPGLAPFESHESEVERAEVMRARDAREPSGTDPRDAPKAPVRVVARVHTPPVHETVGVRSEKAALEGRPDTPPGSGFGTGRTDDVVKSKPLPKERG